MATRPVSTRVTAEVDHELTALAAGLRMTKGSLLTWMISAGLRHQDTLFGPLRRVRTASAGRVMAVGDVSDDPLLHRPPH